MNFQRIPNQSGGYTCIVKLVNCFLAVHKKGKITSFISKNPELDISIAKIAAERFAQLNNIPYRNMLLEPITPIITILKSKNKWYPAEIYADRIELIEKISDLDIGGSQTEAIDKAKDIANLYKTDCIPSIGISMFENS